MQVASCGNVTAGAESKSPALKMRMLVRYSCSEKEPKQNKQTNKQTKLSHFQTPAFQVSSEVQHQYPCFNKRNCDFRVMTPLKCSDIELPLRISELIALIFITH